MAGRGERICSQGLTETYNQLAEPTETYNQPVSAAAVAILQSVRAVRAVKMQDVSCTPSFNSLVAPKGPADSDNYDN